MRNLICIGMSSRGASRPMQPSRSPSRLSPSPSFVLRAHAHGSVHPCLALLATALTKWGRTGKPPKKEAFMALFGFIGCAARSQPVASLLLPPHLSPAFLFFLSAFLAFSIPPPFHVPSRISREKREREREKRERNPTPLPHRPAPLCIAPSSPRLTPCLPLHLPRTAVSFLIE